MKIKTVDVHAKEWFDRVNGNSYFAGRITLNYGMKSEKVIEIPFQYGYGDHYRDTAFNLLIKSGVLKDVQEMESYWRYYERKNIICRHSKEDNCLKREVINFGEAA